MLPVDFASDQGFEGADHFLALEIALHQLGDRGREPDLGGPNICLVLRASAILVVIERILELERELAHGVGIGIEIVNNDDVFFHLAHVSLPLLPYYDLREYRCQLRECGLTSARGEDDSGNSTRRAA